MNKSTSNGDQQGLRTPPQYEFLHSYYTFESVHNSDHNGVDRIFVGLSCEPLGFINFTSSITLHYVEQFFPYQECNFVAANAKLPDTLQMVQSD